MTVGVDLIEIERVRRALDRYPRFRERCFTEAERAYCESRANPAQSYAGRFAGKEAVGKALGFGVARAFAWRDIEIVGRYNPQTDPSTIELDEQKVKDWLGKGVQPSGAVQKLLKAKNIS
jgi:phosphopantetheine--protein transferase-like protein